MDLIDEKFQVFKQEGMHFIHLNVKSLFPKMSEIRIIAEKTNASVIGISETWLDSSFEDLHIYIEGYTVIRKDRENKHGGGVCMYISNKIAFTQLELEYNLTESVWVKVYLPKTTPFIVGTVYSPKKEKKFCSNFKQCLDCLRLDGLDCVVLGDFNICMRKKESPYKKYVDILNLFGLNQLIQSPTRIDPVHLSLSQIDHILVKDAEENYEDYKVGTIKLGLSDHNMIYCTRKISPGQIKGDTVRLKNVDFKLFVKELKKTHWTSFTISDYCVDKNCEGFLDEFFKIINRFAPVRSKQIMDPWMINDDILQQIIKRDRLLNYLFTSLNGEDYIKYKDARNSVLQKYQNARSKYISEKIDKSEGNPENVREMLKGLGFMDPEKKEQKKVLDINGSICLDDQKIANHFNEYFTSVVSKLPAAKGTYSLKSDSFCNFYSERNSNNKSFSLSLIEKRYVYKEFLRFCMQKGTGLDKLLAKLKSGAQKLKTPITFIINQSIESGIVPRSMKQIRVKPLLRKGSSFQGDGALNIENYKLVHVSTLNVLTEIFVKHVVCQLQDFLDNKNLLYELQSGFRSGFSTDTCLINLLDYIRDNNSKGLFTGMLMINLQQAFDTVDHHILCEKLNIMGIISPLFESYLTGRTQVVECGGVLSESMDITCGLPKESILGHLLFLCYINDLPISIDPDCKLILYEDKIAILYSNEEPNRISEKLGKQFDKCSEWLLENKLILGNKKCILFDPRRKLKRKGQFEVKCHDDVIKAREHVKYLGITLDKFLKFDLLIEEIETKVDSKLMFFERNGKELIKPLRLKLASALILPCFDRCLSAWYESLSEALKEKLQKVQDKTIKFVNNPESNVSINCRILKSIETLRVADQVQQLRLDHAHDIVYGSAPKYLHEHFEFDENDEEWASNRHLPVPSVSTCNKGNFYYHAILDWNSLPLKIRLIGNKAKFSSEVKLLLAKKAQEREQSKSK